MASNITTPAGVEIRGPEVPGMAEILVPERSEERRVGKEC